MEYDFGPTKNQRNLEKHGMSLEAGKEFEWDTAIVWEDARKAYPERRFEAVGYIGNRLHVLVFCLPSNQLRVISLRKANQREVKHYAKA
jgi:uncharacterized protein